MALRRGAAGTPCRVLEYWWGERGRRPGAAVLGLHACMGTVDLAPFGLCHDVHNVGHAALIRRPRRRAMGGEATVGCCPVCQIRHVGAALGSG
jgi:hypothetical protein